MADKILWSLVQKMADALLTIALIQFWFRILFFGTQTFQKTGGYMLTTKIGTDRSDRYTQVV